MSTFCVLPWYSKEVYESTTTPCCLLPKDADISIIKKDLLNGVQTSACQKCWNLENQGKTSRRQQENTFLDYKLDRDIDKIQQQCEQEQNQTLLYQLYVSNLCNQACVTCSGHYSTKWIDLEKKMGRVEKNYNVTTFDKSSVDYAHARRLSLLGGEPLYEPQTFEIIKKLIEHENYDCFVSIVTNGSVSLTPPQIDFLQQFTDLNFCISIDGVGPVFEYMRWPGRWDQLLKNIDQYRSIAKNVSVSYTISSVNLLYYNQTQAWFEQQQLEYNHNIVYYPQWASLDHMPQELKTALKHINLPGTWTEITGQELTLEQYRTHIEQQDQVKKISVRDYMPEFASLLYPNS